MAEDFEKRQADRRGFFRESFAGLLGPLVDLIAEQFDLRPPDEDANPSGAALRPPGAGEEMDFERLCTRCGRCAEACKPGAIIMDDLPRIDPAVRPCALCEDLPCVAACRDGALTPTGRDHVAMGTAVWESAACLRTGGEDCRLCVAACPVGALGVEGQAVVVDAVRCTGCGMCQFYCPARPRAVVVHPF